MWKRLPVGEFKWKWEPYFLWHLVGCAGCGVVPGFLFSKSNAAGCNT